MRNTKRWMFSMIIRGFNWPRRASMRNPPPVHLKQPHFHNVRSANTLKHLGQFASVSSSRTLLMPTVFTAVTEPRLSSLLDPRYPPECCCPRMPPSCIQRSARRAHLWLLRARRITLLIGGQSVRPLAPRLSSGINRSTGPSWRTVSPTVGLHQCQGKRLLEINSQLPLAPLAFRAARQATILRRQSTCFNRPR